MDALRGIRVGCVQYLNSRPLIYGLEGVCLEHPRVLAEKLRRGELDAALVPVFELLRDPENYWVVDGVAIASQGPVYSVYVAYHGDLAEMTEVHVDPASLTSVHLVQVLGKGVLGRRLSMVFEGEPIQRGRGRLLIGNQAIRFRQEQGDGACHFWDLGEVWANWTGLPFVYAVWVIRKTVGRAPEVADVFRELAKQGVREIETIVAEEREVPREVARTYLNRCICFGLGGAEKQGLARFGRELKAMGFVNSADARIEFV
ncbi:MAG: Chorismate dehydratase [Verrucomicrobiota bacterium]